MHLLSDQISPSELLVVIQSLEETLRELPSGDIAELGCYVGTTSIHIQPIALRYARQFHVYDSFAGLPAKTKEDESPAGLEFQRGELLASKKQFIQNFNKANLPLPVIHKGWFSDLTGKDMPNTLCFAFLDGDFYGSIYDSLQLVWPRLVTQGKVLVHDYGRATLPGAKRAVHHFLSHTPNAKLQRVQEHIAVICKLS